MGSSRTADKTQIPALCQFWRSISLNLPHVRCFGLNISLTLATMVVLSVVRFTLEFCMVQFFDWPANTYVTKNAASSAAAIFHSGSLVPTLGALLWTAKAYRPSEKLSDEPVWWQDTVDAMLQFCTGYMLYDGLLNIVWMSLTVRGEIQGDDFLFLFHHIFTILYMSSTRILQAGHQSAMICMFFGEMTNPFHNTYLVLQTAQTLDCCNGPSSQLAFRISAVAFGAAYVVIRAAAGPFICLHMTWDLWAYGRKHIPTTAIAIWTLMIWAIMYGSIPWMQACWGLLVAEFPMLAIGGAKQDEL